MGAIPWQVVHQNSKNSTNCKPPDAMLTVVGSVDSRLGPREVATACTVGGGVTEFRLSIYTRVAVKSTIGVAVNSTVMGVVEAGSGDLV